MLKKQSKNKSNEKSKQYKVYLLMVRLMHFFIMHVLMPSKSKISLKEVYINPYDFHYVRHFQ